MKIFLGISEEKLGEIMKKYRLEHNYTQKKVADYLGIDRTTYTKYETVRKPEIDVIMKLAVLYDVSVDEFLKDFFEAKENGAMPFRMAAEPKLNDKKELLTDDEKQLLDLYRESIRKKEILDKVRQIWADDGKINKK